MAGGRRHRFIGRIVEEERAAAVVAIDGGRAVALDGAENCEFTISGTKDVEHRLERAPAFIARPNSDLRSLLSTKNRL
jgi:hypothetical protein